MIEVRTAKMPIILEWTMKQGKGGGNFDSLTPLLQSEREIRSDVIADLQSQM